MTDNTNNDKHEEGVNEKYSNRKKPNSLLECYMELLITSTDTPYASCEKEKDLLRIGKELLFFNKEKTKEMMSIYIEGEKAYKIAVPDSKKIDFSFQDFAGKKHPIYKITADDAGESHAETERFETVNIDFNNQQYKHITGELQDVNSKILHKLAQINIIPIQSIEDKVKADIMRLYLDETTDEIKKVGEQVAK